MIRSGSIFSKISSIENLDKSGPDSFLQIFQILIGFPDIRPWTFRLQNAVAVYISQCSPRVNLPDTGIQLHRVILTKNFWIGIEFFFVGWDFLQKPYFLAQSRSICRFMHRNNSKLAIHYLMYHMKMIKHWPNLLKNYEKDHCIL